MAGANQDNPPHSCLIFQQEGKKINGFASFAVTWRTLEEVKWNIPDSERPAPQVLTRMCEIRRLMAEQSNVEGKDRGLDCRQQKQSKKGGLGLVCFCTAG